MVIHLIQFCFDFPLHFIGLVHCWTFKEGSTFAFKSVRPGTTSLHLSQHSFILAFIVLTATGLNLQQLLASGSSTTCGWQYMIISEALFDWLAGLRLDELLAILAWLPHLIRARIYGIEPNYQDIRICPRQRIAEPDSSPER